MIEQKGLFFIHLLPNYYDAIAEKNWIERKLSSIFTFDSMGYCKLRLSPTIRHKRVKKRKTLENVFFRISLSYNEG